MLKVTLHETYSSDLKMDGWKMTCDLGAWPVIHGHLDHHFFDPIQLSYFHMLRLMVQKSCTTWDAFPKTRGENSWDFNYQLQLVFAEFLKHQQYLVRSYKWSSPIYYRWSKIHRFPWGLCHPYKFHRFGSPGEVC